MGPRAKKALIKTPLRLGRMEGVGERLLRGQHQDPHPAPGLLRRPDRAPAAGQHHVPRDGPGREHVRRLPGHGQRRARRVDSSKDRDVSRLIRCLFSISASNYGTFTLRDVNKYCTNISFLDDESSFLQTMTDPQSITVEDYFWLRVPLQSQELGKICRSS